MDNSYDPDSSTQRRGQFAYRKRGTLEIVRISIELLMENLPTYLLISVPISVIVNLLALPLILDFQRRIIFSNDLSSANSLQLVSFVLTIIQTIFIFSLSSYVASEALHGNRINFLQALRDTRSAIGGYAGAYLASIGLAFVIAFIGIILSALVIGIPILAFAIYLAFAFQMFIAPIFILERPYFNPGMRRALFFGKERFWSNVLLITVISITIGILLWVVGQVVALAFTQEVTLANWEAIYITEYIIITVISAIFTSVTPIAMTIKYYDTRTRIEQLDANPEILNGENPRPIQIPPTILPASMFTGKDTRNVLIIVVIMIIISVIALALLSSIEQVYGNILGQLQP